MKKYGFQVVKSLDFWIFVTETVTSDEVRWPEELPSKFFPLTFSYNKTLPKLNVYFLYQQPAHHEMLFSSIGKSEIANIWGRSKLPSSQFLFSSASPQRLSTHRFKFFPEGDNYHQQQWQNCLKWRWDRQWRGEQFFTTDGFLWEAFTAAFKYFWPENTHFRYRQQWIFLSPTFSWLRFSWMVSSDDTWLEGPHGAG